MVGSISSALAVYEMGEQIRELERAIEVLKAAPTTDEANRKLLEDRLARLRGEKTRLIDPVDIARAILAVAERGIAADQLLPELMKIFYVDLDQFNDVMWGAPHREYEQRAAA